MRLLITGGAGFIGSNFVRYWAENHPGDRIVNLDKLSYAGNLANLAGIDKGEKYRFVHGDICDASTVRWVMKGVDLVVHLAAETHVDRSFLDADTFLRTNVLGTNVLLREARVAGVKRFLHVSTDEVYGSIERGRSKEGDTFNPGNPYSASKAAAEHLVMSYWNSFRFPALVTRCTNNYGPFQYPEKFIALFITNALDGRPLPLYGNGLNERSWLHVEDHCRALDLVLRRGRVGEAYNIAAMREWKNKEVAEKICRALGSPHGLIRYVKDRPGHDRRYALDSKKIERELGWRAKVTFEEGIRSTIQWYQENETWWRAIAVDSRLILKLPKWFINV